jgi:uncharacterized caspase-like protein
VSNVTFHRLFGSLVAILLLTLVSPPTAAAAAAATVHRFTLVIGANAGGTERPQLRYAISDAERFARVLVELGGVSRANEILLKQPRVQDVIVALDQLQARVIEARRTAAANGGRTEVLVYYSGHADEQGLLLGDDRYSYRSLRARLDQIPADVRIAVLDACASGAFTRIKSGKARPAFLVDQSANMRGHAFLTSSAANEAAQESDRIRASYFTHYLVSGFRGAADLSGDGRVTLNEAYQFAFNETLGRTIDTRAGPQHPSYDINLSGTGDVVMTDVRQTSSILVIPESLEGRFFVRNAARELIVELYKPRGRKIELGVEPGGYEVRVELLRTSVVAKAQVADGATVVLDAGQFGPAATEATRARGATDVGKFDVVGRNRFELRVGMWGTGDLSLPSPIVSVGDDTMNVFVGLQYTRYLEENLAMTFGFQGLPGAAEAVVSTQGIFSGGSAVLAVPIGVRWNPFRSIRHDQPIKPFVAASIGPVFGAAGGTFVGRSGVFEGGRVQATMGGHLGAGVDFHVARSFSIGVNGGYNWMFDFSEPVGVRDNYSGPEIGFTLGCLFGKGRQP